MGINLEMPTPRTPPPSRIPNSDSVPRCGEVECGLQAAAPAPLPAGGDSAGVEMETEDDGGPFMQTRGKKRRWREGSDKESECDEAEGGKKRGVERESEDDGDEERTTVFLKFLNKQTSQVEPIKFRAEMVDRFGDVAKIEKQGWQCLKIKCTSTKQAQELLKCSSIRGENVEITAPRKKINSLPMKKGIIFGVPVEATEEDLKEETEATHVMRLKKRTDGVLQPTTSVVLTFPPGRDLPHIVYYGYLNFKVRLFIPRPLRCHKCNAFGHAQAHCRKMKHSCPRCAGDHPYSECQNKEGTPRCSNCGGGHSAAYAKCPTYVTAQEITKTVAVTGKTYRDALIQQRTTQKPVAAPPILPAGAHGGQCSPPPSSVQRMCPPVLPGDGAVANKNDDRLNIAHAKVQRGKQAPPPPPQNQDNTPAPAGGARMVGGGDGAASITMTMDDVCRFLSLLIGLVTQAGVGEQEGGRKKLLDAAREIFKLNNDQIQFITRTQSFNAADNGSENE